MATKEVTMTFETTNGALDPVSFQVSDGDSAYQIWLKLGNEGSEADFIASLSGAGATVIEVTSANRLDALSLPAGRYLLKETDNSYALSGVPSFYPRNLPVVFEKTDSGVNLSAVDGKYYINTKTSGTGWAEFSTSAANPTYRAGNSGGVYWGTSNYITQKSGDTMVFGTPTNTVNYFSYSFSCPWNHSIVDGVNMMWAMDGRMKFFMGGDSGSTPSKDRLHIIPTVSQTTFEGDDFYIPGVSLTDNTEELAKRINSILGVLQKANLIREAP